MILKRYGSLTFIDDLDIDTFIDLLHKAMEKEWEDKLWEKWLHFNSNMSFEEFKDAHTKKKEESKQSDDEIMEESLNILMSISKPR